MVFMQDIAVTRAYRLTKLHWLINYVNKYEELYPHLSRNKAFISSTNSVVNNETKNVGNEEKTQQPSFAEKLRYNFLILIFKKPKESNEIINDNKYYFDYNNNNKIRTNIKYNIVNIEKIM